MCQGEKEIVERIIPHEVISSLEELRKDRSKNADFWYERANMETND